MNNSLLSIQSRLKSFNVDLPNQLLQILFQTYNLSYDLQITVTYDNALNVPNAVYIYKGIAIFPLQTNFVFCDNLITKNIPTTLFGYQIILLNS